MGLGQFLGGYLLEVFDADDLRVWSLQDRHSAMNPALDRVSQLRQWISL